jgi:hypothetical protein
MMAIARLRIQLCQITDQWDSAMRSIQHVRIVSDWVSNANGLLRGPRYSNLHHNRTAWVRAPRHAKIPMSAALFQYQR